MRIRTSVIRLIQHYSTARHHFLNSLNKSTFICTISFGSCRFKKSRHDGWHRKRWWHHICPVRIARKKTTTFMATIITTVSIRCSCFNWIRRQQTQQALNCCKAHKYLDLLAPPQRTPPRHPNDTNHDTKTCQHSSHGRQWNLTHKEHRGGA